MSDFTTIRFDIADAVTTIQLNRRGRMNPLIPRILDDIRAALDRVVG